MGYDIVVSGRDDSLLVNNKKMSNNESSNQINW